MIRAATTVVQLLMVAVVAWGVRLAWQGRDRPGVDRRMRTHVRDLVERRRRAGGAP